jgi:LuxR family maltose regulon positive regulatory protein
LTDLAEAPAETMLFCRILAMVTLVHAHLDSGDVGAAQQVFEQAEALIEEESFGVEGRRWLALAGTVLALAAGDHDGANRWAAQVDDPFWSPISDARVHLAAADRAAAGADLQAAEPRCIRHEVVLALLKARAADDRDTALKHAARAVELASANGLLQTIAAEGAETLDLVEHVAWRAPAEWCDRLRRAAAEAYRPSDAGCVELVEPLTERERDVLRFLPSRLTVREIADELYVSVNTVKFHLRVIYRKLGVSSRAEAAAAARKMAHVKK